MSDQKPIITGEELIVISVTRKPDPTGAMVEEPCNVVFERKVPLGVYSPEEHGVIDAQFVVIEGHIRVQLEEPNNGHVFPDREEDDLTCEQCDVRWLDRHRTKCTAKETT